MRGALALAALVVGCDRGGADIAGGGASPSDNLFHALDFGGQATPVALPMPAGKGNGPSVAPAPGGPPLVATPSGQVTFDVPWQGGPVSGVNLGFGEPTAAGLPEQYFRVIAEQAGRATQGTLSVVATVGADVCRDLAAACHPIRTFEQVRFGDGATVSAPASGTVLLGCGGVSCAADAGVPDSGLTCAQQQAAGSGNDTRTITLGRTSGTITVTWDMYGVEDRLTVSYEGRVLVDTGCVAGAGQMMATYAGVSSEVTAQVIGDCLTPGGSVGSAWEFTVGCPL